MASGEGSISVEGVKVGIGEGNALVALGQASGMQVVDGVDRLPLEALAQDFDALAERIAGLADAVDQWPVSSAQQRHSEADRQFAHSLNGGLGHPSVITAFGALGEMGAGLSEAARDQMSLREKLLAIGGAATDLARQVREEAIPGREKVRGQVSAAIAQGTVVKEETSKYRDSL